MQVNIEIRLNGPEDLIMAGEAIKNQPVQNHSISCGYNSININYDCKKNHLSLIKNHWKRYIADCIVVSF